MKKDRRVQRTRQLLHEALLALIVAKGYDAVTVQDVLKRAKVARSSFYSHFRDKDDLLFSGFQDIVDSLPGNLFVSPATDNSGYPDLGLWLFRHVEQNKALAQAMLSTAAWNMVSGHLRNLLVVQAKEWADRHLVPKNGAGSTDFVVHYLVGALLELLTWWVRRSFPRSADEMGAAFKQLARRGLEGSFS